VDKRRKVARVLVLSLCENMFTLRALIAWIAENLTNLNAKLCLLRGVYKAAFLISPERRCLQDAKLDTRTVISRRGTVMRNVSGMAYIRW